MGRQAPPHHKNTEPPTTSAPNPSSSSPPEPSTCSPSISSPLSTSPPPLPTTRLTYWAIGHLTPGQLLAQSPQLTALALLTLTLGIIRRPSTPYSLFPIPCLLAYYLQGTGWYYQQLPAIIFCGLALAGHALSLKLPHSALAPRRRRSP